jgi:hypothetical protein
MRRQRRAYYDQRVITLLPSEWERAKRDYRWSGRRALVHRVRGQRHRTHHYRWSHHAFPAADHEQLSARDHIGTGWNPLVRRGRDQRDPAIWKISAGKGFGLSRPIHAIAPSHQFTLNWRDYPAQGNVRVKSSLDDDAGSALCSEWTTVNTTP